VEHGLEPLDVETSGGDVTDGGQWGVPDVREQLGESGTDLGVKGKGYAGSSRDDDVDARC